MSSRAVARKVVNGAFAAVITGVVWKYNPQLTFPVLFTCWMMGMLPVPTVFSMLYRLYTTKAVGYNVLTPMLHPKRPPHVSTLGAIRKLVVRRPDEKRGDMALNGVIVVPIPVLADNYSYLIVCERTRECLVIDPADPQRVWGVIQHVNDLLSNEKKRVTSAENIDDMLHLTHVLTTHKHWDHAGGNEELKEISNRHSASSARKTKLRFVGSAIDNPACTNTFVTHGDTVRVGDVLIDVLDAPGHTRGAIMFVATHDPIIDQQTVRVADGDDGEADEVETIRGLAACWALCKELYKDGTFVHGEAEKASASFTVKVQYDRSALFTGDCIFCGGCGAMFETDGASDVIRTYDILHALGAAKSVTAAAVLSKIPVDRLAKQTFTDAPQARLTDMLNAGVAIARQERDNARAEESDQLLLSSTNSVSSSTTTALCPPGRGGPRTLVYVGHEYTLRLFDELAERARGRRAGGTSGDFSKVKIGALEAPRLTTEDLEEGQRNRATQKKYESAVESSKRGTSTMPSSMEEELMLNPLLTLDRRELLRLKRDGATAEQISEAVYLSDKRMKP